MDTLFAGLSQHGHTLSDVVAILVTHIHLDHSGSVGTLIRRNGGIRAFVHGRGARHLIDPTRLLRSAARVFGSKMDELWGEVDAVPAANVEIVEDGRTIGPAGRDIDVLYTPGHAVHHVTYYDRTSRTAFVGDTAGMRIEEAGYVMPVAPPPDVDLAAWRDSLQRLRNLAPERLFLTHFGSSDDVDRHLEIMEDKLAEWARDVRSLLACYPDERGASRAFTEKYLGEMRSRVPESLQHRYESFASPVDSFRGISLYLRRQ
ncbi:MAG: MBL fold metallo-hydrolase [Bacteroidota bacterium]